MASGGDRTGGDRQVYGEAARGVRSQWPAGVPERVAMKVNGHETGSAFDRYHIVSPTHLQDVARRHISTREACFPLSNPAEYQHAPVAQLDRASAF